jgi:hypothetical protein
LLDDLAVVHHRDAVGRGLGEAHLVGDGDHGHAVARELLHHRQRFARHLRVERAGRLVEQHQCRLHGQRALVATRCCWPPDSLHG